MKPFTKFMVIAASSVCAVGAIAVLRLPLSRSQLVIEAALITLTALTTYGLLKIDGDKLEVIDAERV